MSLCTVPDTPPAPQGHLKQVLQQDVGLYSEVRLHEGRSVAHWTVETSMPREGRSLEAISRRSQEEELEGETTREDASCPRGQRC